MSDGYTEAVEHIARRLMRMSKRDFDPLSEKHDGDEELVLEEFIETNENHAEWAQLENAALLVCRAHGVDYIQFMSDVWSIMIQSLESQSETWH